jgi:HK97 family phage portal protein
MGLFDRIATGLDLKAAPLDMLPGFLWGPESKSGISVTWSKALQVTAMLACARVVAEDIAQCGARLMRKRKTRVGADPAADHPLYALLWRRPNSWQTAFEFIETLVFHLMLVGNAFVFVSRSESSGRILELIILDPGKVRVTRLPDLTLQYDVTLDPDQRIQRLSQRDIWHLRGPSWNGWMGMETVRLAREALGLAIALEQSHSVLHRNGLKTAGEYSIEGPLNPEQHEKLVSWLKRHAASGNMDPLILDRGAKWLDRQMTGVDAQHVEVRRLQVEEICRAVRVLPIMVGVIGAAGAYDNGEQMFLAHRMHTLTPWSARIEQSAECALLTDADIADGLYVNFNLNSFQRADYKSRQEGLQIQRRNGVINADEWRDLEDMNPREDNGGSQYIVEGNMAVQDGRDLVPIKTVIA